MNKQIKKTINLSVVFFHNQTNHFMEIIQYIFFELSLLAGFAVKHFPKNSTQPIQ